MNLSSKPKKKLCFYNVQMVGHMNISAAIGKILLDKYFDRIEIYFIGKL